MTGLHTPSRGRYVSGCRCQGCTDANAQGQVLASARRAERGLSAEDPRHGKASTYTNWRCRCAACAAAHRRVSRLVKASLRTRGLTADDQRHGTPYGYDAFGCRCAACRQAKARYQRLRRQRQKVDELVAELYEALGLEVLVRPKERNRGH